MDGIVKRFVIAVLFPVLLGMTACGERGAPSTDEAEQPGPSKVVDPSAPAEPQRVQIPDTKVPLFVEVRATGHEVSADRAVSGAVSCEASLYWGDGKNATDEAPWTGSLLMGKTTELTFHLVLPVTKVDFEYVVVGVTPRSTSADGIRFDIETMCYACIR